MTSYFVIHNSEGDTSVERLTKPELLERLNPADPYYGSKTAALGDIPNSDTNYWGEGLLIIKGTIVTPEAKVKVQAYDID